jgi:PiT family inorganic phosphate transporter
MALGGVLQARRVAETMAHRIADLNDGQGFTANLVSSALVLFASRLGLPVSTTHVTCGALFGIGAVNRTARWRTISKIALAWLITLPISAGCAALAMGWIRS